MISYEHYCCQNFQMRMVLIGHKLKKRREEKYEKIMGYIYENHRT